MRQSGPTFLLLVFFLILFQGVSIAQGKINAPAIECLGNLTSFSYTPPSGLTLSSASWDFGDGNGSSTLTPVHTYGSTGFYTLKINATFTNSSTAIDSMKIEVVGLPKAYFYLMPFSDSCLSKNVLRYKDTSVPAITGQTITSRLMVWGDGTFESSTNPKNGDILKHTYPVASQFTLKLELTDKHGCIGSMTKTIDILEDIHADAFVDTSWSDCKTTMLCVRNQSTGTIKGGAFQWFIDTSAVDTNAYFPKYIPNGVTGRKCITYQAPRTVPVMLIAIAKSGCRDTFTETRKVTADTLLNSIEISDTLVCRSTDDLIHASVKRQFWDTIYWKINGSLYSYAKGTDFYFTPKNSLLPGTHTVSATIVRGPCNDVQTKTLVLLGPVADFRIYDNYQCHGDRQLFFVDESRYANRNTSKFRWTIIDKDGDKCVSNRAKGINKYMNCNQSVDWYTKHKYNNKAYADTVWFWIKDTVTGCEDFMLQHVVLDDCPPILKYDSVTICQNDLFMIVSPQFPEYVTFDSGKTWKKFAVFLDSSYVGLHDVGFAFKTLQSPWAENFGDDSIKLHKDTITYYDTTYRKKFLRVFPLKDDEFTMKVYGDCKPFRVSLHLKDGHFLKGETLTVQWNDGVPFNMTFTNDTIIDSVFHIYNKAGIRSFVRIFIVNIQGCTWKKSIDLIVGKNYYVYIPKEDILCKERLVCFTPIIKDYNNDYLWDPNSMGSRKVSWKFDDSAFSTSQFSPCHKFVKAGKQAYKMFLEDHLGCKDTFTDTLFIQEVKADVKYLSRIVYCSELKQFLDSSFCLKNLKDSIKTYSWKFGDGVYSSFVKHPLQVINTSLDSIEVMHAVETVSGCVDTMVFNLKIIGPNPYFHIRDTIGCGSLLAEFVNLSRNSKSYLWEFGDAGSSTLQTSSKQNVTFNYTKPGRYYIYLTGYDTVFNPIAGKTFYCKNTFPDKLYQKDTTRSVLVLPYRTTGIQSRDTVCLGSVLQLKSLSDTGYSFDFWDMGDSSTYLQASGSGISHSYQKEGTFTIKLNPGYNDSLMNELCRDSAQKTVLVIGVKADFTVDPVSVAPLFKFYNKSLPASAALKWDFCQPASGQANTSGDQNPSHDYGDDTGTYNVCLIASLPEGCSDTICKTIYNDYLTEFKMFNVFTPGNPDGKNDEYDILLQGEDLYDLEIYNRWGVMVFKGDKDGDATNKENWNGKVNNQGEDCPSGTYYYIFKYSLKGSPEDVKTYTGVITLIR